MPTVDDYEEDSFDDSDLESIDEDDLADATLPEPEPVQIKVSTLLRRYRSGLIELNPYYQRDVVWPQVRQSGLINSIFNNYYIPPVIFQCKKVQNPATPNARPTLYQTAIDGKQRLSSIIEFMAGRIPYKDPRGITWWYPVVDAKNKKGRILTKELKDRFDNWSLLCIEYIGLKQQQEEDLFARVQQGMALSNNEKQMASHTPWIKLVKEIMKTYKLVTEICGDMKRGKDFGNIANVVVAAFYNDLKPGNEPLGLKTSQASLSKVINKMDYGEPSAKFAARMRLLFSTWTDLYNASPSTFSNAWPGQILKKFSPIEFLATGVLLDMYLEIRDNETLIGDIDAMRRYIRTGSKVVDLRTNTGTWRWFWDFIESLETHRGKGKRPVKADRITPRAVELAPHPDIPQVPQDRLILSSGPLAPGSASKPKKTPAKNARRQSGVPRTEPQKEAIVQSHSSASRKRSVSDSVGDIHANRGHAEVIPTTAPRASRPETHIQGSHTMVAQTKPGSEPGEDEQGEEDEEEDEIFADRGPTRMEPASSSVAPNTQATTPNFSPELVSLWNQMQQVMQSQQQAGQQAQQQQQQQPSQSYSQQSAGPMSGAFMHPMQHSHGGQAGHGLPGSEGHHGHAPAQQQYYQGMPTDGQQSWQQNGAHPDNRNTILAQQQPPPPQQQQQQQQQGSPVIQDQSVPSSQQQKRKKIKIDLGDD